MNTIKKTLSLLLLSAFFFCGLFFMSDNQAFALENEQEEYVYLGGFPIGIQSKSDYFTVSELVHVISREGTFSPAQKAGIQKGDVILSLDGQKISSVEHIAQMIQNSEKSEITLRRGKEVFTVTVQPSLDSQSGNKKLGVSLRNELSGIGTMTFIRENGEFGALGHQICDGFGYSDLYNEGTIYPCVIFGYKRAKDAEAGELCGRIDSSFGVSGIYSNNKWSGIYGKYNEIDEKATKIPVAQREEVREGKARICTTIDGKEPSFYDVEIVKAHYQKSEKEKGMLLRVTDKKLLGTTGGILQGMSGSPILQNGKIVGAVTHVFTNDSTMGYGIYIDWMLQR